MVSLIFLFFNLVASLFKSKSRLEAENAALQHQLTVLQRKIRGRVQFTNSDRLFFIQLYRWCPSVLKAMMIIRPETVLAQISTRLRKTLASLGSHQANVPVIPIRQCTKRFAFSRASLLRKRPARLFEAAKRLNFRITQSRRVRLMYRSKGYRADGAYRP